MALLTRSLTHAGLYKEDRLRDSSSTSPPSSTRLSILPGPLDNMEAETRRRLFWMIFLIDRYSCVATGWWVLHPGHSASFLRRGGLEPHALSLLSGKVNVKY